MTMKRSGMSTDDNMLQLLEQRLGPVHARQRLGIESEGEPQVFGRGLNFFHPENWYSAHALIRYALKLSGFYWAGHRNTLKIRVRRNVVKVKHLSEVFDGFRLLHLSDLHSDLNPPAMQAIADAVEGLEYDVGVITGDYRAQTFGPVDAALEHLATVTAVLRQPSYGVFGNHDSIRMLPGIEDQGVRMLLNEHVEIRRGGSKLYLVGIDDAHYYRVDNVAVAASSVPFDAVSILLSHTPEIYRQAAHAGFDLMLCGHTHGGQICLPGGVPITLDSKCPRYMGKGAWRYRGMQGYTSAGAGSCIVPVRLNCPPEVTVHTLRRG
jgi:predicted MPP superfamily phosphohydrolase